MIRGTVIGDGFLAWKAWTAKFAFRRALFKKQIADTRAGGGFRFVRRSLGEGGAASNFGKSARDDTRAVAVKRAAAAEVIAQEANAARLKALLDAAREQATVQTIEVAERRFVEAKGEWEAAQKPFLPDDVSVGDEEYGGPDTVAARFMPDGWSVRQIVLRSTAVAGLLLAGAIVYFDPDFGSEAALGDTRGVSAEPAKVYTDIDPVASVSWPAETAADAPRVSEGPAVEAASTGETAVVRKVSTLDGERVQVRRAVRRRVAKPEERAPAFAPTPARNPFYVIPEPPAVRVESTSVSDFE